MDSFEQIIKILEEEMNIDYKMLSQYGGTLSTQEISVDDETKFTLIKMENVRFDIMDKDKCIPQIKISETHISEGSEITFKTLSREDIDSVDNLSNIQFLPRYLDIKNHLESMINGLNKIIVIRVDNIMEGYLEYDISDGDVVIIDLVANKSCNTLLFSFAKNVFEQCGITKIYLDEKINKKDSIQRLRFWQKNNFISESIDLGKYEIKLVLNLN